MIQAYHYVCKKAGFCSTWYKHIIMSARRQVSVQHDTSMSLILWEKVAFCSKWYKHIIMSASRQVSARHDTSMSLSLYLQKGRFLFKMIQTSAKRQVSAQHDTSMSLIKRQKVGFPSKWYKHIITSASRQISAQHDTSMSLCLWEKAGFCSTCYKHGIMSVGKDGFLLNMLQAWHYVCGKRQVSAQHDTSMSLCLWEKMGFCSTWHKHGIMSVGKGRFLLNMTQACHYVCGKRWGFCSTWHKHGIMSVGKGRFLLNMTQAWHYVCGKRQVSAQHDTSMALCLWEKAGFCSTWYKHVIMSVGKGRFLLNVVQAWHSVCGKRQVSAQRGTSMASRLQEDRFLLNISEHDTSMSLCVAQHNPVNADC